MVLELLWLYHCTKQNRLCCDNYRGISLLSRCEKVIVKVILQSIQRRTKEILSEAQVGLRVKWSMTDQLFTLWQLAETYVEFGKSLYVCCVDCREGFRQCVDDRAVESYEVSGLWRKTSEVSGVTVWGNNECCKIGLTEWSVTVIEVMQGCMLSKLLLNILLEVVMA